MTPAAVTSISRADIPVAILRDLELELLLPSRTNPRRDWNEDALNELTASIREHGIQSPLLVRSITEAEGGVLSKNFEIVAGHRRHLAARRAGLKVAPCIVRHLTDEEAAEIALIDNLQRVDIPPMDEAEAFGELLDRLLSLPAVAAKVGKEVAYVAKALKLRSLTEPARMALTEKLVTIDHARLLCRLAEEEQNEALKWCLDRNAGAKTSVEDVVAKRVAARRTAEGGEDDEEEDPDEGPSRPSWRHQWEPETVQRLKEHIETESGTPLDRAPWRMEEAELIPDAGACSECEKNTKANAPLFGDIDTGVAVCTDGGCFKAKTEAFVQIALKMAATSSKAAPIRLSWKSSTSTPRMEKDGSGPSLKQVFKYGQWLDVGPKVTKCEHTRPGVAVDCYGAGHKPGEVIQVCIQPKCKTHTKAYEKRSSSSSGSGGRGESYEVREAREKKELEAFRPGEMPVRRALYDAIAAKLTGDALKSFLLRNANAAAICAGIGFETENWKERQKHAQGLLAKAKGAELDRLLVASAIGDELEVHHYDVKAADKGRGDLRSIAKDLGIDPLAIERAAEKAIEQSKPEKPKKPEKPAAKQPAPKAIAKPAKKTAVKKAAKKAGRK
jgi:ParB family chromosome partitioning protein